MLLSKHIKGRISDIVIHVCNFSPVQSRFTKFLILQTVGKGKKRKTIDQVLKSFYSQGSNWTKKMIEICSGQAIVTSIIKKMTPRVVK